MEEPRVGLEVYYMIEHLEKEIKRYVIATLDNPTFYVVCNGNCNYSFVDDIRNASKFNSFNNAMEVCKTIVNRYGDGLVVLNMKIKYFLCEPEEDD